LGAIHGVVLVFAAVSHEAERPGGLSNFLRKTYFAVFSNRFESGLIRVSGFNHPVGDLLIEINGISWLFNVRMSSLAIQQDVRLSMVPHRGAGHGTGGGLHELSFIRRFFSNNFTRVLFV